MRNRWFGMVAFGLLLPAVGMAQYQPNSRYGSRRPSPRQEMVEQAYQIAFGRYATPAELQFWVSRPANDPRLANVNTLVAAHLAWLRTAPSEQNATAQRALHAALNGVAGIDSPAVIHNAVVDMLAGRNGGGYRGLVSYLEQPQVRQWYVGLAQSANGGQPAPSTARNEMVEQAYQIAFGRNPTPAELQFWVSRPANDPRLANVNTLVAAHLAWLRTAPSEQNATAQRALHAALNGVAGIDSPAVIHNAVGDMLAGRNGGGYRGLVSYLEQPQVRQWYISFAQRSSGGGQTAPSTARNQMVEQAYQIAFGRNPTPAELQFWVSRPANDPRMANVNTLVAAHLAWLRGAPTEQNATAERALHAALNGVAGIDSPAVIHNAVGDMLAGRNGGGYRGLVSYLEQPQVRQWYISFAQRSSGGGQTAPSTARNQMVEQAYEIAFGRNPTPAELQFWVSRPANDPRMANVNTLVAAHLAWLRGAPAEQNATAQRALHAALNGVAGIDSPAVIHNAVVDMLAGRNGGGYRGLVSYLEQPQVRQWYIGLAQRNAGGGPSNAGVNKQQMIVGAYQTAFGRNPTAAELQYWLRQPVQSESALVAFNLNWLKNAGEEQRATAQRALHAALGNVGGIDQDGVINNAIVDMMAGRNGGGYHGLLTYLQQPQVRQWYTNFSRQTSQNNITNAYLLAFGRYPTQSEMNFWLQMASRNDPRLANVDSLVAAHLAWLRGAQAEQHATAQRALHAALPGVPGIDQPAVISNAVTDMMAGRNGGGYQGLFTYLQQPQVHQWYVNLAQRSQPPAPAPPAPRDARHGWNPLAQQFEQCFGAVGPGCEGVSSGPYLTPARHNPDGSTTLYVSVGSIMHDNCCLRNGPSAVWCGSHEDQNVGRVLSDETIHRGGHCAMEWSKAVYNSRDHRYWIVTFPAYTPQHPGDDLTRVPNRPATIHFWSIFPIAYTGGETVASRRLMAPSGTALDWDDVAFCASGQFRERHWAGPGSWGICK